MSTMAHLSETAVTRGTAKTLSVALTTYNGEQFLPQQLNSIAEQTRPPDRLVVNDDGSTDRTIAILHAFAARAPFPVAIHRNEVTLGWRANFMHTLSLCDSDLIALCDQDDVWHREKLAIAAAAFDDPETVLFCHNAALVDATGQPLGPADIFPLPPKTQALSFQSLFSPYGFAMVCARSLLALSDLWEISVDSLEPGRRAPHDQWLFFLASIFGTIAYSDRHLTDYRQHGNNAVGIRSGAQRRRDMLRNRLKNQGRSYGISAQSAAARAVVLHQSQARLTGAWLERAVAGELKCARLARLLRQRAALYSDTSLFKRLAMLQALHRDGAYKGQTGWEPGRASLLKDAVFGILLRRFLPD